jgi:uncharacterized protein (TIGR02453 family)
MTFNGFPAQAFDWFTGLEADNSKAWFTAHRTTYDSAVRGALEAMLDELADETEGRVKMFRQNRDVRFSADKSPYKTATYGVILDRPDGLAGLYAQLSSRGLFAGTGYYQLARDQLERFRDAVVDARSGSSLEEAIEAAKSAGIDVFGEALKTGPRGYPRDHARVGLLRHKALFGGSRLAAGRTGIPRDAALGHARTTWAACAEFNSWLDRHVGASSLPPVSR